MAEKRWFLIKWLDGMAFILCQPTNDKDAVMAQYDDLTRKKYTGLEVCETII